MLVAALSVDLMVAGIAYGSNRIAISPFCAGIINIISTACLGAALCLGTLIDKLIPEKMTVIICFVSLFVIGLWRITAFVIKRYIKRGNRIKKHYMFSMLNLDFVIYVSGNPVAADQDNSSQLSPGEAVILAFAMSLDGIVAGIGAAFLKINIPITLFSAFIVGMVTLYAGYAAGRLIAKKLDVDLSWLSGVLFVVLAFMKLK